MIKVFVVFFFVVLALLRGGSLLNINSIKFHWNFLVFSSIIIQVLIFTPFRSISLITFAIPWLYSLSMGMLVAWVFLNRHIPGMVIIALGLLSNTLAIVSNGGFMPVSQSALQIAKVSLDFNEQGYANNSVLFQQGQHHLWVLCDILPLPQVAVYSIGDVLLTAGVALACYRIIRPSSLIIQPAS
jgi:hypothetical protein